MPPEELIVKDNIINNSERIIGIKNHIVSYICLLVLIG